MADNPIESSLDNTEVEYKMLISENDYRKLCEYFKPDIIHVQTNEYFETYDSQLKRRGYAIRIRTVENRFIMTIKKPRDAVSKFEYEREISTNNLQKLSEEDLNWAYSIIGLGKLDLKPLARFTTTRNLIPFSDQAELCIDKTEFSKHTDYELEFETRSADMNEEYFNHILKPFGLHYEKNCASKLARAVRDLN